jgi:hypothetical protein
MGRKKIIQIDGKQEKSKPSTLEQIWGDNGLRRYKTTNQEEYTNYLLGLNKSDLQTHAASIGILPQDNRELLSKKLIKEFRTYVAGYNVPDPIPKPSKVSPEVLRILAEGR